MRELTIIAKDRIGLMADITEVLGKAGINIEGISAESSKMTAIISLVVDDYEEAVKKLEEKGFKVMGSDIIVSRLKDKPGELAKLSRILADAKVGIDSIVVLAKQGDEAVYAIKTDDNERAKTLLKKYA